MPMSDPVQAVPPPSVELIVTGILLRAWLNMIGVRKRDAFLHSLAETVEDRLGPQRVAKLGQSASPIAAANRATARAWLQRWLIELMRD